MEDCLGEPRQISTRHRAGSRPILVAGLMMAALGGDLGTVPALHAQADTTRSAAPFRFRKTVVPSTDYLARVIDAAAERRAGERLAATPDVRVEVDGPPATVGERAAAYAKRYRISGELAAHILEVALAEGLDPDLAFRLVRVESMFKPRARGPQGALGLTQLMPGTARSIDRSVRTESQILEPRTNLRLGFRYLRGMIDRYDGNVRLGLLAYNRGETAVNRALRSGRDPENGYSHKVLGTRGSNPYRGKGVIANDR